MTTEVLTKDKAITDNLDPRGIKWGIFPQTGRGLFIVGAVKESPEGTIIDSKYRIPKECDGEYTHPSKAQFAISQYLNRAWEESDAIAERSAQRKRQPQPEETNAGTENR